MSMLQLELSADEWWNKLNGEERRAYVQAHPRSRYAATFNHYKIPFEPGTEPIPDGHVRLYHQTNAKYLRSIRRNGLEARQPFEGPRGLYADEEGFYGKPENVPTVEFHVPKEHWDRPFVKTGGSIYDARVEPENIIAVHHPWHQTARYIESEPDVLNSVLNGEDDKLLNDKQYGPAIRFIKHRYGHHVPAGEAQETATNKSQPSPKREDFEVLPLYHSTPVELEERAPHRGGASHIWAADGMEDLEAYSNNKYEIHPRKDLKTAQLYGYGKNNAMTLLKKKFGANIEKTLKSGKLWRNKKLERSVIDYLFSKGYDHIILTDEQGEDGGETTSHIINHPEKNIWVGDRRH